MEFAGDSSAGHHQNPIAQANHLRQFRRNKNNSRTLGGKLMDDVINFGFSPDINASRRFIQNENPWLGLQPFRDDNLLLIASAQVGNHGFPAGGLDAELGNIPIGNFPFFLKIDFFEEIRIYFSGSRSLRFESR